MVNVAEACGERTTFSHSASAGATSSPKRSLPSTRPMPSTRATRWPTILLPGASARSPSKRCASQTAVMILR